jgi:hypothetical protein
MRYFYLMVLRCYTTSLGKETLPIPRCDFFAKCYGHGTRESSSLPSVTLSKVTIIPLFIYFCHSIQTNKTWITYTSQSSKNHHIHQTHDIAHKDHMFLHKDHKYHKIVHNTNKYSHKWVHKHPIYAINMFQLSLEEHQRGGRLDWCDVGLGDPWGLFDAADCPYTENRLHLWDQMNIYLLETCSQVLWIKNKAT